MTTDEDLAHDAKLDGGWALWEGNWQHIANALTTDRPSDKHAHSHRDGPFFDHSHPGGREPHDHAPSDRLLPAWTRKSSGA